MLRHNFSLDFGPDGTPTVAGSTFTNISHHKRPDDVSFHGTHPELQQ
ncbi:hypothetical protein Q5H92_02095 [Hymenobacter sp. M29]|uniref:Uncharacterized protein n=1 Tax=Hymenobacter mellowenesis TaxID=3063995 RepID=A0ABT9A5L2_9BACT|nr:hypothetical protein [Hymenobacter sp. M29]MDO7845131.1 hypothetical protein [Hymenobacter sp. M29]